MKRKKQMAFAVLLMIAGAVNGQNVYAYKNHAVAPALQMQDVQRIAFGSDGIDVVGKDGSKQSVSYESFDYLRFYDTSTGAVSLPAGEEYSIYSITGIRLADGKTSLEDIPSGLYIVKAKKDGQEESKTILKK